MSSVRDLPSVDLAEVDFDADTIDVDRAVRAYRDVGFFVVRRLLSRYMERMHEEIQEAVALAHSELEAAQSMRYGWLTPSGGIFSDRAGAGDVVPGLRQLIAVPISTTSSDTMRAYAQDPALHEIIRPILDNEVHPTGTGQCMYKEALRGTEAGLHQDGIYPGDEKFRDVIASFTYVVPTPIERGCIWLVPYSHRLGLVEHEKSGARAECIPYDVCDFDQAIPIPGGPGDTLFWNAMTIHGSKANVTDLPRPAVVVRFGRLRQAQAVAGDGEAVDTNPFAAQNLQR